MHKMMDQKDIVENRIDFLSNEKSELLRLVKNQKLKPMFLTKKEIERKKHADAKDLKALDKLGRVSKQF